MVKNEKKNPKCFGLKTWTESMRTLFGFVAGENDGLHMNEIDVFGIKQL